MSALPNGWELEEVREIPAISIDRTRGYLDTIVDTLMANPNSFYRVFSGKADRVASRRASMHSAVTRRGLDTAKFKVVQRTHGSDGELYAAYLGGGAR
jgi:hypothetical protein